MSDLTLAHPKLTERALINALMRDRWQKNFCLPNYTPPGWWECDLFEVTPAGYFREYEVKLSIADFRADRSKQQDVRGTGRWVPNPTAKFPGGTRYECDRESKHDLLAKGDARGPSQFYFVTPAGLLDTEPLPPWAGWLEVYTISPNAGASLFVRSRVEAPRIHRVKLKDDPNHHRGTCYWRMHREGKEHV